MNEKRYYFPTLICVALLLFGTITLNHNSISAFKSSKPGANQTPDPTTTQTPDPTTTQTPDPTPSPLKLQTLPPLKLQMLLVIYDITVILHLMLHYSIL